jgi:hypothetical protein
MCDRGYVTFFVKIFQVLPQKILRKYDGLGNFVLQAIQGTYFRETNQSFNFILPGEIIMSTRRRINRFAVLLAAMLIAVVANMAMSTAASKTGVAIVPDSPRPKTGVAIVPDSPRPKTGVAIVPDSPRPKTGVAIVPDSPRP